MKMKKNDEPLKVVIDTQEFPFDNFSWSMDKSYIKEPKRNTSESFENLVPFSPTKYILLEDVIKLLQKLGHNAVVDNGKSIIIGEEKISCSDVKQDNEHITDELFIGNLKVCVYKKEEIKKLLLPILTSPTYNITYNGKTNLYYAQPQEIQKAIECYHKDKEVAISFITVNAFEIKSQD